ncbi:TauD/TfdA family dioxygenase [Candidatus Nitrospira bockiana]
MGRLEPTLQTALQTETWSGSPLPLVVRVPPGDDRAPDSLADAAKELADARLYRHGAILFRGFPVRSVSAFERFVRVLTPTLLDYEFGSTPRSQVTGRIYTSTEYPAHQTIPLHNEQAYTTEWPMKIWFHCAQAAPEGGETPIADSRRVFDRIPTKIRDRFIEKQLMYVRNYGNGLDVPWQQVFNTTDRAAVEAYCRGAGIQFEWKPDGELRTRQVCQAAAVHPRTGERVWFNQAHLFHVSNLDPQVREALLAAVGEEDLPRNVYYGDGAPLESSVLDEIRSVYDDLAVRFPWQEGDLLMVDNMLVAHGRMPFRGPRRILVAMAESHRGSGATDR